MIPGIMPVIAGHGDAGFLQGEYVSNALSGSNTSSYSLSGVSLGSIPNEGERRFIVLGMASTFSSGSRTVSTFRIAGVDVAPVAFIQANRCVCGIYILEAPTGTSATVAASFSGEMQTFGIGVCRIVTNSDIDWDTGTDTVRPIQMSVSAPKSAYVVGVSTASNDGSAGAWTGLTERFDIDMETTDYYSMADGDMPGAGVLDVEFLTTTTGGNQAGCLAAFWAS